MDADIEEVNVDDHHELDSSENAEVKLKPLDDKNPIVGVDCSLESGSVKNNSDMFEACLSADKELSGRCSKPFVCLNNKGTVIVFVKKFVSNLFYMVGVFEENGQNLSSKISWGNMIAVGPGDAPQAALNDSDEVVLVRNKAWGNSECKYGFGTVDKEARTIVWTELPESRLGQGINPTVALIDFPEHNPSSEFNVIFMYDSHRPVYNSHRPVYCLGKLKRRDGALNLFLENDSHPIGRMPNFNYMSLSANSSGAVVVLCTIKYELKLYFAVGKP